MARKIVCDDHKTQGEYLCFEADTAEVFECSWCRQERFSSSDIGVTLSLCDNNTHGHRGGSHGHT